MTNELRAFLKSISSKLDKLLVKKDGKDAWDIFSIVATAIAGVGIAGVGGCFTKVYNDRQFAQQTAQAASDGKRREIEIVTSLIPHLEQDGRSRTAGLLAIGALGTSELMIEMARLYGGEGAADALARTGQMASDPAERRKAFNVYIDLIRAQPSLGAVGPVHEEEFTYEVTLFHPEQRTHTVTVIDPATGEPREEERVETVMVPLQEERTGTRSVIQPVAIEDAAKEELQREPTTLDVLIRRLQSRFALPDDQLPALRRQLLWMTEPIETGDEAGKLRFVAPPAPVAPSVNVVIEPKSFGPNEAVRAPMPPPIEPAAPTPE